MLPHAQVLQLLLLLPFLLFHLTSSSLPPHQSKLISERIGPLLHLNQTSRYAALFLPVHCSCCIARVTPAIQSRVNSPSVRIWAFDHNFDGGLMDYPQQLLRSPARDFIDGIAYHNYAGKPHTMCRSKL